MNSLDKTPELKSNINNMETTKIETLFKSFDCLYGHPTYRGINVILDTEGKFGEINKKYPTFNMNNLNPRNNLPWSCENNNLTIEQLQQERDSNDWKENQRRNGNSLSLYVKHIPKLYVIDFDTYNLEGCKLKDFLDEKKNLYVETKKGFHYYVFIPDMIEYTDQQKIYIDDSYEIDLIKTNNIWETKSRVAIGTLENINTYEWANISHFFNVEKMTKKKETKKKEPKKKVYSTEKLNTPNILEKVYSTEKLNTPKKMNNIEFEKLRKSTLNLNPKRAESYKDWIDVGMALFNNGDNMNNKTLEIYHEFSKQSKDKYNEFSTNEKWESFKPKENGLTIGSIYHWEKEDNPDLKESTYDDMLMKYLRNQTEYEMGILLKEYIKDIYCIESEGRNKAFIIPNEFNRWEKKNKAQIGKLLSEDVYKLFIEKMITETKKKSEIENEIKEGKTKELDTSNLEIKLKEQIAFIKRIKTTSNKLQTQSAKTNYISALVDNTYEEGISDKLDETNLYLINFDNGAYDLRNSKFIIPDSEDFVSKTTGFKYESKIDKNIRDELMNLLNKIYKDEKEGTTELRDYNLKLIASSLCGVNKYEGFYVWTGAGGNGKGLLDSLCSMVFGEYYDVIDKSFFTSQKKSSGQADPELAGKKGIRMLVSSECEKSEEFQANKLKLLSGNDNISTRGLFQEQFRFIPQFTIFIQSNGSPNLSQVDKGVKRRFRLIEHPTQFVKSPDPNNRFEEAKDTSLKEKFRNDVRYRQQMILILIEYYNKYIRDDKFGEIETPKVVREFTDNFIYDNDIIGQFFFENKIKTTHNPKDIIQQKFIWEIYKNSNFNEDVEMMKRNDLYKLISNYEGIKKIRRNDGTYFSGLKVPEEILKEYIK